MKENLKNQKHFLAAMYLRLSRDDNATKGSSAAKRNRSDCAAGGGITDAASIKSESNSIGGQRELIRAYIQKQPDIELYDIYVDDTAIIGLNQKTLFKGFYRLSPIFYTLFTQTQLLSNLIYYERSITNGKNYSSHERERRRGQICHGHHPCILIGEAREANLPDRL